MNRKSTIKKPLPRGDWTRVYIIQQKKGSRPFWMSLLDGFLFFWFGCRKYGNEKQQLLFPFNYSCNKMAFFWTFCFNYICNIDSKTKTLQICSFNFSCNRIVFGTRNANNFYCKPTVLIHPILITEQVVPSPPARITNHIATGRVCTCRFFCRAIDGTNKLSVVKGDKILQFP